VKISAFRHAEFEGDSGIVCVGSTSQCGAPDHGCVLPDCTMSHASFDAVSPISNSMPSIARSAHFVRRSGALIEVIAASKRRWWVVPLAALIWGGIPEFIVRP
jgi:hypothetical protein